MWIKVNNNPTGLEFSNFKVFDQKDMFKKKNWNCKIYKTSKHQAGFQLMT